MAKRYHIGSHLSTIEIGGKFRNAHKYDDTYTDNLAPNAHGSAFSIPESPDEQQLLRRLVPTRSQPGIPGRHCFCECESDRVRPDDHRLDDPANYDLVEKVGAGYLMDTIDVSSRVRIVAGVRFENTNLYDLNFDTTRNTLSDSAERFLSQGFAERLGALRPHRKQRSSLRLRPRSLAPRSAGHCASRELLRPREARGPSVHGHTGKSDLKAETGDNLRRSVRTLP